MERFGDERFEGTSEFVERASREFVRIDVVETRQWRIVRWLTGFCIESHIEPFQYVRESPRIEMARMLLEIRQHVDEAVENFVRLFEEMAHL